MKTTKISFWTLALWLAFWGCECEQGGLNQRLADLQVDPDPVDFGQVPVLTGRQREVTLKNAGSAVVQIKGLSVLENSEEFSLQLPPGLQFPQALPPGGRLIFTVSYRPQQFPQDDQGRVLISSTDSQAPEYRLVLLGQAVQPVLLVEPVPVDFGSVRVKATQPATLTIRHSGSQPGKVQITGINFANDGAGDFRFAEPPQLPRELAPQEEMLVHLAYTPQAIDDQDWGELMVVSDAPEQEQLSVPLKGSSHAPAIEVEPAALDFGTVRLGQHPQLSFFIRSRGNDPLTVKQMSLSATGSQRFELSPQALASPIEPLGQAEITVTYLADVAGEDNGQIAIQHDDPLRPQLFITLHGRTPTPDIDVVPDNLTLRLAHDSHQQDAEINIYNRGDDTLTISSLDFSNPQGSFSLVSQPALPADLPPGPDALTVVLRFEKYQQTSGDTCYLTIHSNDPDEAAVVVTVVGVYTP
jgi:hypothetical protein